MKRLGRFTEFVSRPVESGLPMNIEELSAYTGGDSCSIEGDQDRFAGEILWSKASRGSTCN